MNIKTLEILTYLHVSIPAPSAKLFLKHKALSMSWRNDDSQQICPSTDGSVTATPEVSLRSEISAVPAAPRKENRGSGHSVLTEPHTVIPWLKVTMRGHWIERVVVFVFQKMERKGKCRSAHLKGAEGSGASYWRANKKQWLTPKEKTPTDTETQLVFTQNHRRMTFLYLRDIYTEGYLWWELTVDAGETLCRLTQDTKIVIFWMKMKSEQS